MQQVTPELTTVDSTLIGQALPVSRLLMIGSVSFRTQGTSGVLEAFGFPLSHSITTVAVPAVQRPEHEEGVTLYFTAVTLEWEHV